MGEVGEIGHLIGRMKENAPVPAIETDLVLEKIRRLYEDVRSLNEVPESTRQVQAEDTMAEKPAPEKPVTEEPVTEKRKQEPEILADKYKGETKYISETLSQKGEKQDITARLQSKPIKNIRSSLGINDRFKLINELFQGDKDSFENTIGILDDADNFNEAFSYINSSFEWDMEDEAVQMLLDLVRRKFIVKQDG